MDAVLAYAKEKGMGVIPMLNTPGHMDAILAAATSLTGTNCAYSGSARTIDVTNSTAVAFTQAFVQKYVDYFASKGCKYFNMGADEYANDKYLNYTGMGFGKLLDDGNYGDYITYINTLANMIDAAGMTPMAFNDGIYYGKNDGYGTVSDKIVVCYWSSGWGNYSPASASYLKEKGFKLVNTHGDYYWVLGKPDAQCSASKAKNFDIKSFPGSTINDPSGAMFCIWADYPDAETEASVISKTADTIAAFGATLPKIDDNKTVSDEATGVSVTAPGLTGITVAAVDKGTELDGKKVAGAWNIELTTENGSYTDSATVSIPVGKEWLSYKLTGGVLESDGTTVTSDPNSKVENGVLTFTAKHFSTVVVLAEEKQVPITVTVGGTEPVTVDGEVSSAYTDDFVTVKTETKNKDQTYIPAKLAIDTLYVSTKKNDTAPTLLLTFEDAGNGQYYIKNGNGQYISPLASYHGVSWRYSVSTGNKAAVDITTHTDGSIVISRSFKYSGIWYDETTAYLTISGSSFAAKSTATNLYLYGVEPVKQTTISFTGKKAGTTRVKIGDVLYIITVSPENLDNVSPLTIEYWITNKRVSEGTTYSASTNSKSLTAAEAHKEDGVELKRIVPETGRIYQSNATAVYWKGRRLPSSDKQTEDKGVDKTVTATGTDVTRVRYWGGAWQYSGDGKTWTSFATGDQFVAYYLQKTTVTEEIQTEVADWGENFPYSINQYVLVDYAVKLESGERVPDKFPITNKTQVFHCTHGDLACAQDSSGNYYRNIGYIRAKETADYEVYMITLTPTSDSINTTLASNAYGIGTQQSNFYAGTEKVIWVDDEANLGDFADESKHFTSINGDFSYSVGGEPAVPGLQIYDRHGMLITYYVRTKTTEDSLTVHYIDKTANREFYFYNIAVAHGTYFDENIGLDKTTDKSWKGPLVNGEVTNLKGNKQTVSADLSTLPALSAQYRYSDYTCVEVTRSEADAETGTPAGKEVYLYYTFNSKHTFVVDFGVPLKIGAKDINLSETGWTTAKVNNVSEYEALYGTAKISLNEGLTYTLTKPMQGVETLQVTLGKEGEKPATHTIYLIPATTVYYEQNVATYSDGWNSLGTIAADKYQQTQPGRTQGYNNFGFDQYYEQNQQGADGSVMYTTKPGESAQLTFKGTGMELYLRTQNANATSDPATEANNATDHSYMLVQVYAGDTADANSLKRMSFVDVNNLFVNHSGDYTYGYNTPCWTVDGMAYDTYTVVVRYVKGTTYGLAIDGFRVTNTLNPDNAKTKDFYAAVGEANMQTAEIRNMVLAQANVYALADNWYKVGSEVIDAVFDKEDAARISGAVLIKKNYNESTGGTEVTVDKDLVNIGPKNEIYLNQGEAVVMQLTGSYDSVQVGMRSLTGEAVSYKINGTSATMNSTVDMYYKVVPVEGKLVIQNVSGGILALTRLKVTSKTAATGNDSGVIPQTTPEAIRYAMALMRGIDVPQFTDVAEDAWYHDYVYDLVYRGVVNGMTATTYEPEGKLTRAQFVKLLACSLEEAETLKTYEGQHPFTDSEGHWAETYIAWAKDKGIVEGVSATEFDPEAPITREQMATIFGRYALKQGIELPKDAAPAESFPDADKISEYAREFVELMRIAGILNGYEDGTFRPQGNATRAEAAKLFSLFLSITDKLAK